MTVASVSRSWSLNRADSSVAGSLRTAGYDVTLSDSSFGEQMALTAVDPNTGLAVPKIGEQYKPGDALRVKRKQAKAISPLFYRVTVEYDDRPDDRAQQHQDPFSRPPEIQWFTIRSRHEIDETVNGDPIMNVAGEPYDGVEHDVDDPAVRIRWNRAAINAGFMLQFVGATNSQQFLGAQPGQAKVDGISAAFVEERIDINGQPQLFQYWRITAEIHFREGNPLTGEGENQSGGPARAWYTRLLHAGFKHNVAEPEEDPVWLEARTTHGHYERKPVALDRHGRRIPPGEPAFYQEFQTRKSMNFAGMGIPL